MAMNFDETAGGICAPKGFRTNAVYAGVRSTEKEDFVLIASEVPASSAGCLTRNAVRAWCVQHNAERLKTGKAIAMLCVAGNANACNGQQGKDSDKRLAELIRNQLGGAGDVLTASTGVIGRPFPLSRTEEAVPKLVSGLGAAPELAARGIMTTDLVHKEAAVEFTVGSKRVAIGGIAKGSGMIAPNMATMLSFITTDIEAPAATLQKYLSKAVAHTFNRITVDGDTSTNDMALALANGRSGVSIEDCPEVFEEALEHVCLTLAKAIARDGEGATKLISVTVKNGPADAEKIARMIAESPLVKTACFGNDPNWGRILMAAGRSGAPLRPEDLAIRIAGIEVFRNGEPAPFDAPKVSAAMKVKDLLIEVEFLNNPRLGHGFKDVTVWTCDFSYDYVKINADYTT